MKKTTQKEANLGQDPVGSLLFRLALPSILAQLINVLYNMVDRMYIGHIPEVGANALTGVGVCMPVIMCISAFADESYAPDYGYVPTDYILFPES